MVASRLVLLASSVLVLSACSTPPSLQKFIPSFGSSSTPSPVVSQSASQPTIAPAPEDSYCPRVSILADSSSLRSFGGRTGDGAALRHQISIGDLARECQAKPDGSIVVKVGVEARVLLGPAGGSGGRYDAPVQILVKSGNSTLVNRSRRLPILVASGETFGSATLVEEGILVPASAARDFEIEVGLGVAPTTRAKRR
jgi:hypothetical protein